MKKISKLILLSGAMYLTGLEARLSGAVVYSSDGSIYTQNFNTLVASDSAAWANNTTLAGWYWSRTDPALSPVTPAIYVAANGTGPSQGNILSLGNTSDRAFGAQNSNTAGQLLQYGLALTNSSGSTLNSFNLSYNGEQWRAISGGGVNDKLSFEYQVFAAGEGSLTASSGWTALSSLDFAAPVVSDSNSSVNGNVAGQSSKSGGNTAALNWGVGQELWLRWTDTTTISGNNPQLGMLGVDDVAFSATVPEPGQFLLATLALGLVVWARRKRPWI